jgi:hypothetical protein
LPARNAIAITRAKTISSALENRERKTPMATAPATNPAPTEGKLFGAMFKVVLSAFVALVALRLWVMISMLPYVWVSDVSANCGARLVLSRAAGQMYLMLVCLVGAAVAFALLKGWGQLVATFPVLKKFAQRVDPAGSRYSLFCTALLGVALLAMLGTLVSDFEFFNHPPNLPANVRACAHPANVASW